MSGAFVLARSVFAELRDLAAAGGKCAVLTPEQEETLQHFQHEIASRMTDDVPAVDRMQLYDLLRVEVVYNSETDKMVISGLFGEATVHDIRMSNRTNDRDTLRRKLSRIFIGDGGLHTEESMSRAPGQSRFSYFE